METTIFVVLAVVILVLLMVVLAVANSLTPLRVVAVSEEAAPGSDPPVPSRAALVNIDGPRTGRSRAIA